MKKVFWVLALVLSLFGNFALAYNGPDLIVEKVALDSEDKLHVFVRNVGNQPAPISGVPIEHAWYEGDVDESNKGLVRSTSHSGYLADGDAEAIVPGETREVVVRSGRELLQDTFRISIDPYSGIVGENSANNIKWIKNATDLVVDNVQLVAENRLQVTVKNSGIVPILIPYPLSVTHRWSATPILATDNEGEFERMATEIGAIDEDVIGPVILPGELKSGIVRTDREREDIALRVEIDHTRAIPGELATNNVYVANDMEDIVVTHIDFESSTKANVTIKNVGIVPFNATGAIQSYSGWYTAEVPGGAIEEGDSYQLNQPANPIVKPGETRVLALRGIEQKPIDKHYFRIALKTNLSAGSREYEANNIFWVEYKPDLAVVGIDFTSRTSLDFLVRNVGNAPAKIPRGETARLLWYPGYVNEDSGALGRDSFYVDLADAAAVEIKPGETKKYSTSGYERPNGCYTISVELNHSQSLPRNADGNQDNNTLWKIYVDEDVTGENLAEIDENEIEREIIVAGGGTSEPSVPGDFANFLKRVVRGVRWSFTTDSGRQVEISLRDANEKIVEVDTLIKIGRENKIPDLIKSYSRDLERAKTAAEKLKGEDKERAEDLIGEAVKFQIRHQSLLDGFIGKTTPEVGAEIENAQNNALKNVGEMLDGLSEEKTTEILSDAVGGFGTPFRQAREYDVLERIKSRTSDEIGGVVAEIQKDLLSDFKSEFDKLGKKQKDLVVNYTKTSGLVDSAFSRDIATHIPSVGQMIAEDLKHKEDTDKAKKEDAASVRKEIEDQHKDDSLDNTHTPGIEIDKPLYDIPRSNEEGPSPVDENSIEIETPALSIPEYKLPESLDFNFTVPAPVVPAPVPANTVTQSEEPEESVPTAPVEIIRNPSFTMTVTQEADSTYRVDGVVDYFGKGGSCTGPKPKNPVIVRWGDAASEPAIENGHFSATHKYKVRNSSYTVSVSVYSSCYGMTTKTEVVHPEF